MKKLAMATFVSLLSTTTIAAPVGSTFSGFGLGGEVSTIEYDNLPRATGVSLVVDYGINYGKNFVGIIEGKFKLHSSNLINTKRPGYYANVDEKWRASVGYLQGYRVLPDLLPYVKLSHTLTSLDGEIRESFGYRSYYTRQYSQTSSGIGLGLGVKYAVASNFELGAEYFHNNQFSGDSMSANTFSANATYRF